MAIRHNRERPRERESGRETGRGWRVESVGSRRRAETRGTERESVDSVTLVGLGV
jgi:hypothetical protein